MDNTIILKFYNGDISSKAYSASVLMGRFFPYMKVAVSITVWFSDNIILCGTRAKQFFQFCKK